MAKRKFRRELIPKPEGFDLIAEQIKFPLSIEIGSGTGLFAIEYALNNPQKCIFAIEKTSEKYRKFLSNFNKARCPQNLIVVHGNAVAWLAHLNLVSRVDEVFILYPNPYPKAKQANKRFYNMSFMGHIKELLRPGGEIIFRTNLQWVANEILASMTIFWRFAAKSSELITSPRSCSTAFEKKYLVRGEVCYELVFVKGDQK